jgi:hypothetical protein
MVSSFRHPVAPARAYSALLVEGRDGIAPRAEAEQRGGVAPLAGGCSGRAG